MRKVIVNINLEIDAPDDATLDEAMTIAENYELPHGYVEGSYEFVGLYDEKGEEWVGK